MTSRPELRLLETAGLGVSRYRLAPLRVDYVSAEIERLLGVPASRFYADPSCMFEAVHPEDRALLTHALADMSEIRPPLTLRWRLRSGRVSWVEHHRLAVHDESGRLVEFIGLAFDVSGAVSGAAVSTHPWLNATALRALSERIEQMREEERTRIARELHDELGQLLTGAKLDFSATIRRLRELRTPGDVVDRLQSALGQIDIGIAMVRRIATDLRPPALDHEDLGAAMAHEARRVEAKSGLTISVSSCVNVAIEPEIATVAFRVFQEALTNTVRHSRANRVAATVAVRRGRLLVYVTDNGIGIPPSALRGANSIGLLGMRERAVRIGGRLRITGRKGRGTRLLLTIPLRTP
ncbi:MAG: histidine kinase [Vicinamibacterales bacterium]